MRNSKQKYVVAKALIELYAEHPTAAEVYQQSRKMDPNISLGTVYRNLGNLVAAGEVKKITVPDSADRYDPQPEEHHHVACLDCGMVFDIDIALTRRLNKKIAAETGVVLENLQLIGTGHCQNCIKNKKGEYYARAKRQ
jgi:Fur family peroxide stress response transcriptional regulator